MVEKAGWYAGELRRELGARSRLWALGRTHVESYGSPPVIVFAPEHPESEHPELEHPEPEHPEEERSLGTRASGSPSVLRHGNFFDPSYAAIAARREWLRRFQKIHAQGRSLPKSESGRRWRELDSSMSSDALLMNVFCAPGVAESPAVRRMLGVDEAERPVFGWKARVPLANGRFDRTEVDMRWGGLLVEAKLTESDFQTRAAKIVESYRDFDQVFERDRLPRIELREARRRTAVEFAEAFTQEWEAPAEDDAIAHEFQAALVAQARLAEPAQPAYAGYQLIRNVLAAYAAGCSFCVMHDERRPDLREAWFEVMAAVKSAEMRVRCKVLTWQELAALLPEELQQFLQWKYGIAGAGKIAPWPRGDTDQIGLAGV